MYRSLLLLITLFLFAGCSYPRTDVDAVDSRPTLVFKNAPKEAIVYIDGIPMGKAATYNGNPKVLAVLPGTHEVILLLGDTPLLQQTIYVESENKTITIPKVSL